MEQSPQLQRALLLHEQGRHEMAEKELRQHLAMAPADSFAHAILALSLVEQERFEEAEQSAREAISCRPDASFSYYALASVLSARNREDEAASAIAEAIRLNPTDAGYHGMRAAIEFDRGRWRDALDAAHAGLQFDAENATCNNVRAMALVKLGRKAEAAATIEGVLARDPNNAVSHANQGWALLEQGKRKEAMHHFRESLRIDPTNDWARSGLVEALKAGNPLYAVMLRYFLWMQKLSDGARWGIIVGGFVLNRALGAAARSNAELAPWLLPLRALYITFVVFTWLAYPLFNLLLFLHPAGRHALDDEQRAQAQWVGACLGLALGSVAGWLLSGGQPAFLMPALVFGLLSIPTAAIFTCAKGWPRNVMVSITVALAIFGLTAVLILAVVNPPKGAPAKALAGLSFGGFIIGTLLSQWIANWLSTQKPKR